MFTRARKIEHDVAQGGTAQIGNWEEGIRLLCLKSRQDLMTTDTGDERKKKPTYRYGRFDLRHDLSPAADCVGFFSRHKAFVTLCPAVSGRQFPQPGLAGEPSEFRTCCHTVRAPAFPHS